MPGAMSGLPRATQRRKKAKSWVHSGTSRSISVTPSVPSSPTVAPHTVPTPPLTGSSTRPVTSSLFPTKRFSGCAKSARKYRFSYAEGARRLGMSEAALRKAVERLRRRYQELFRQEIAHTVTSPAEVEDELRHLQTVMRG